MKQMNVYKVYIDDDHDVFKVIVPAESEKDALNYVAGNGEVIAVKENKYMWINTNKLANDLQKSGWGCEEIDLIVRTLSRVGFDEERM